MYAFNPPPSASYRTTPFVTNYQKIVQCPNNSMDAKRAKAHGRSAPHHDCAEHVGALWAADAVSYPLQPSAFFPAIASTFPGAPPRPSISRPALVPSGVRPSSLYVSSRRPPTASTQCLKKWEDDTVMEKIYGTDVIMEDAFYQDVEMEDVFDPDVEMQDATLI